MWFKDWVNKHFDAPTVNGRCNQAAKIIGCSPVTMIRLYYGYKPRSYVTYKKLAESVSK